MKNIIKNILKENITNEEKLEKINLKINQIIEIKQSNSLEPTLIQSINWIIGRDLTSEEINMLREQNVESDLIEMFIDEIEKKSDSFINKNNIRIDEKI